MYAGIHNEICVGGVYLRLYNKEPGFALRNAKRFAAALIDEWLAMAEGPPMDAARFELVSTTLANLLNAHPIVVEHLSQLGHVPKVCTHLDGGPLGLW